MENNGLDNFGDTGTSSSNTSWIYDTDIFNISSNNIISIKKYSSNYSNYYLAKRRDYDDGSTPTITFKQIVPRMNSFSLDWVNEWDGSKTYIGEQSLIAPNVGEIGRAHV